ncbi:type IV toxin-antitoxin system AbiEi family antitoxin domain-containing protein [Kitasatospora sp. NBC_00240]|uniref:type IV toxin-antitoxin system AbiEi family antitoxin domain-containing protein n=1 Tax=Kitasatospora sp. NBC_00240 TaxID=2903567 RepID=UPI00224F1480|nr:type IV toxin-antitoxin system AbiEi family antitoxin domain-containing protein [Kitasatospora sp. NBC_00240]MCX5216101.1 type IV toxin-antitoxin system AbiEi family antitoxin domain-containing protein [Kitasatospora sp. NBC_00240]
MNRAEQMVAIGDIAAQQWGLITAAQAKKAGLSGVHMKRLTDAGLLESISRGVYLLTGSGYPAHLDIAVAWLRLQPAVPAWERRADDPDSAVVSHASACLLHGLGDIPSGEVELTVPRRRVTREPFVKLHIAALEPDNVVTVDGLPVTTVTRTVVDLLRQHTDGGHVGGVIAEADRRDLVSAQSLAPHVARFAKRYGLPQNDGIALVEHLVAQAGDHLHSQEVARATQDGIVAGWLLAGHPGHTRDNPDLVSGEVSRLADHQVGAVPLSAVGRGTLQQLGGSSQTERDMIRNLVLSPALRESIRQLGTSGVQDAIRNLADVQASLISPAMRESIRQLTNYSNSGVVQDAIKTLSSSPALSEAVRQLTSNSGLHSTLRDLQLQQGLEGQQFIRHALAQAPNPLPAGHDGQPTDTDEDQQ